MVVLPTLSELTVLARIVMKVRTPLDIRTVIDAAGGCAALAAELGICRQTVHRWKKVPSDRVLMVARITGLDEKDIRPDVFTIQPVNRPLRGIALDNRRKLERKQKRRAAKAKKVA